MRRAWLTLAACLAAAPAAAQRVVVDNQAQHVVVDSCAGCGGAGTSFIDGSAFTAAVDAILNVGGVFNDGLADLTAGNAGAFRLTKQRALHTNLRTASGTEVPLPAALGGSGGFKIECLSGCGGASSFSDNAAFTAGTTSINIAAGVFDDTLASVTAGNAAAPRITNKRGLHINLRDASGNEIGTSALPVFVSPGSGASFAVTGTFWPTAAGSPSATRLSDGAAFYKATTPSDTQPISAVSLPLPTGAATDSTLTGGTQQSIVRGGAKGATAAATLTSTAEGADHQAGDVQLYTGGAAIDPRSIRALTSADVVDVSDRAGRALGSIANTTFAATQGTAAAATAPWPVSYGVPAQVSGSLVNSGDTVIASVAGLATVAVKLSIGSNCAGAGCQVFFEASADGGSNYNPVYGYVWKGTATLGSVSATFSATFTTTAGTQTPALGIFSLPAGVTHFHVLRSADGNLGTVSVTISPGAAPSAPPLLGIVGAGSTATLGTVNQGASGGLSVAWTTKLTDGVSTTAVKAASTAAAATDPAAVVSLSPNSALPTGANTIGSIANTSFAATQATAANLNATVTPIALTKGTQGATGFSVQNLYDAGRSAKSFYANNVAAGTTTTETLITLTQSSGTGATSNATTYTITNGKTFRITALSVASRGNATATVQSTVFNLRLNTAGACVVTSTPILFAAQSATPATASAWDRVIIPIPDGYEIAGNGTIAICISAAATYVTTGPTWSVNLIGYEY